MSEAEKLTAAIEAKAAAGSKMLWKLVGQAEEEAAAACDRGEMEFSADLHDLAAALRRAYAAGRRLKRNGKFVAPQGGDK